MSATVFNNNNTFSKTVYLVCRDNLQNLPVGYVNVSQQVRNNPDTIGNYTILPGKKVTVAAGKYIAVATDSSMVMDNRIAQENEEIRCWV